MADPQIVMVTLGTLGDVIPFTALAIELERRGHAVVILSNENHADFVESRGIEFIPVAGPEDPDSGLDHEAFFTQQLVPSFYTIEREIRRVFARGEPVVAVNRFGNWGALFACERHGIPFFSVLLQPDSIWEHGHPISKPVLQTVNSFREDIGLQPIDVEAVEEPAVALVSLFPDWFGDPRSRSAKAGRCFGFPFLDAPDPRPLPDDIASLIARHGAPVVFAIGTNVRDIARFQDVARTLHADTGLPVLFLSRFGESAEQAESGFRHLSYVDHAQLLPHAAAVVHNGGVGVTAQAMRAGIWQIVVPLVWDQPDNAARIVDLGVGHVVEPADLTATTLAAICRQFATADRKKPMVVADAVRRTCAIPAAVDHIRHAILNVVCG